MLVRKITRGFVVQTFDTATSVFKEQEFIADSPSRYETMDGKPCEPFIDYLAFAMTQPCDFAEIAWRVDDIKTLRPEMTTAEAEEFLQTNERAIQEFTIEKGWTVIECLLNLENYDE